MVKNKKTYSETDVILITLAMPILSLVLILISVSLNQRGGPVYYTPSYDSSFYHELAAVVIGYCLTFVITLAVFSSRLSKLGRKLPLGISWLAIIMLFWRLQGMGLKSLDCGGRGYSSSCTHLLPDKLDNTITAVVFVSLLILSAVAYGWLRMTQESHR